MGSSLDVKTLNSKHKMGSRFRGLGLRVPNPKLKFADDLHFSPTG